MARGNTWTNKDGLVVGFGTHSRDYVGQATSDTGAVNELVFEVHGPSLGSTIAAPTGHEATIPAGAIIHDAQLFVDTSFAGDTATLDMEFVKLAGTTYGANGIDAAIAVASLIAGFTVECDGVDVDASAVPLTEAVYVSANYNTAAFTAGHATLVVRYVVPTP